jgi:hypothetical protein
VTLRRLNAFRRVSARGCCGRREAAVTSCAASASGRPAVLCAAAFGPALADADGPAPGLARMGVLVSVGADVLARLLEGASSRARSASADAPDLTRSLEAEISRSVREVLDAGGSSPVSCAPISRW